MKNVRWTGITGLSVAAAIPGAGQFLLPAAQNIPMMVFFGVSTAVLWKRSEN